MERIKIYICTSHTCWHILMNDKAEMSMLLYGALHCTWQRMRCWLGCIEVNSNLLLTDSRAQKMIWMRERKSSHLTPQSATGILCANLLRMQRHSWLSVFARFFRIMHIFVQYTCSCNMQNLYLSVALTRTRILFVAPLSNVQNKSIVCEHQIKSSTPPSFFTV